MARQDKEVRQNGRRMWIVVGAIVVAVLILAAFVGRRRDVPVRAVTVEKTTITATIQTNGKIEPIDAFEAHAPFATTVRKILVQQGAHVKAGQLLLQLDDADAMARAAQAQAAVANAQANVSAIQSGGTHEEVLTNQADLQRAQGDLNAAQRNLDAMRKLQQSGAASAGEVADAENRLKAAQAQVHLLQSKLHSRYSEAEVEKAQAQTREARASMSAADQVIGRANIRAPRAGTVYYLPVREGQFVNSGDLLVQVADLSKVQLRAFVDEPDIGKLAAGQPVKVTWDGKPTKTWEGEVTHIPTTVVPHGTRNVGEFTCIVNNQDETLLPNVNVNVNIITARDPDALVVPREAIHQDDNKRFVYQVVNGELKRRDVQTSLSTLTETEVTQGLKANDVVALGSANGESLKEGMAVRVVQE
ncbi:MAG: efflux RND transporter periplasmic adaptor subunit [Terriglobales bacterium]